MKNLLSFFFGLAICNFVLAQQTGCKVSVPEINENYSGECRKGLAHGYGTATGIDRYEGTFTKGMPDGKGTYTWASGKYYEGEWKKGLKTGRGKMVDHDSTLTGYWKENKFLGTILPTPYKITRSISVSRSSITKLPDLSNEIRLKIKQSGTDSREIENLTVASTSGNVYNNGNINGIGIENIQFPVDVVVKYITWNKLHSTQYDVIFEFTVNDPGLWEVIIHN